MELEDCTQQLLNAKSSLQNELSEKSTKLQELEKNYATAKWAREKFK